MVTVRHLGHTCYTLETQAHTLIFDPFLRDNPDAVVAPEDVAVDFILPSHGHSDHLGDTIEIAKRCDALVIAVYELAMYCERQGARVHPLHIGGGCDFEFGRVKLTPAWHGSAVVSDELIEYTGPAGGFLVNTGGKTIYYAGDTGLFGDMALIGRMNQIDLAFLPIGDNFTMDIQDAAEAAKMLDPKVVIPMHYNTFPVIEADPNQFAEAVRARPCECAILEPGQTYQLSALPGN